MIIIAQGNIELTQTCEMYTVGSVVQIMFNEGSLDVSFSIYSRYKMFEEWDLVEGDKYE